ncbi:MULTISPECIES: universal stress protein [Roseomonadaceae]|uniref:Universal stress protein n=1 Tax=Falsiroseomonas oleicola TaxID=2801474 RepID=A0ABS6HB92_9PROT|nr:universal stress protein [Roseomonas oleicola]MBU8545616.1 universal stress protein [Roseomonas oleicola]
MRGVESARRRLLVATDLSARSDRALGRAALLAQASGAELVLLHAVNDDQPPSLIAAERREALLVLQAQAAALQTLPAIRPVLAEGDPFEAILRAAEAEAAELVVLGQPRRRLLRDIFVGTTMERVLRHGHRPLLVVKTPPATRYRHLLVATDLSAHAARALRAAVALGLTQGAEVTLLHVFETPGSAAMALADLPAAAVAAHHAQAAREAQAALARFAAPIGLTPQPQFLVASGRPATVVKDLVARLRPDLLVLGTEGAGGLKRAVLGSVAAELLAEVACDALVVPPAAAG